MTPKAEYQPSDFVPRPLEGEALTAVITALQRALGAIDEQIRRDPRTAPVLGYTQGALIFALTEYGDPSAAAVFADILRHHRQIIRKLQELPTC